MVTENFDTRSDASSRSRQKLADLNADKKLDKEDSTIWRNDYDEYLKNKRNYKSRSDLNGDKVIDYRDMQMWVDISCEVNGTTFSEPGVYDYLPGTYDPSGYSEPGAYDIDISDNKPNVEGGFISYDCDHVGAEITSLSAKKYLFVISKGEYIIPEIVAKPSNITFADLVYDVANPSIVQLDYSMIDSQNINKWMVGVSPGSTVINISSKKNPSIKIIFYVHVVNERAVPLSIGEQYDFNGYGVTKWREANPLGIISLDSKGIVTGKKRGTTLLIGSNNNRDLVRILVGVDLVAKPTYSIVPATKEGKSVSGYMLKDSNKNRPVVDTNKVYTKNQKDFLENYLTQKIESVGGFRTRGGKIYQTLTGSKQGSRAGAVAAARFLALEFQYGIPYANGDWEGKVYTKGKHSNNGMLDFGNWIFSPSWYKSREIVDLYGYKLNIHDANDNNTGKGCWGCSTGGKNYTVSSNKVPVFVEKHGLHCSSFVSWALYNGGLNIYSGMKSINMVENLTYMASKQPGAEYIVLADANKNIQNVTEEQWKKVKAGDLIYRTGHIGMIIGIDHKNKHMYVAHQTPDKIGVDRINYMRPQDAKDFGNAPWQSIILMDNIYGQQGYYSSMW